MAEQEKFYDIYKNEDDELLFAIKTRDGEPESPKILYDGKEHALFYRKAEHCITLDYIHSEIREVLSRTKEVLMVETSKEEEVVREYMVPVRQVKTMPKIELEEEA